MPPPPSSLCLLLSLCVVFETANLSRFREGEDSLGGVEEGELVGGSVSLFFLAFLDEREDLRADARRLCKL